SLEIGGGVLADGKGRISAIESGAEDLVIVLVEAEESHLQIVLLVVGGEAGLAPGVGGGAVFRGGDGNVVGIAGVVAAVVVVEGRNRSQEMGIESVDPAKEDAGIGLVLAIAKAEAGVLRGELVGRDRSVLDVVGIRIVRDLIIVAAGCGHQGELVGGVHIEDKRY